MRTSAFYGAKDIGFFEIYGTSARAREVKLVRTFYGQGERGSIYRNFVQTTYMDGPI